MGNRSPATSVVADWYFLEQAASSVKREACVTSRTIIHRDDASAFEMVESDLAPPDYPISTGGAAGFTFVNPVSAIPQASRVSPGVYMGSTSQQVTYTGQAGGSHT